MLRKKNPPGLSSKRLSTQLNFNAFDYITELNFPTSLTVYNKMITNDPIIGGMFFRLQRTILRSRPNINHEVFSERLIREVLRGLTSAIVYGFYVGEIVVNSQGQLEVYRVPQMTITDITEDAVVQEKVQIPMKKVIFFRFEDDLGSIYGRSLLRHVYKPYYYKVALEAREAVSMERDLSGLPVLKAPEGFDFLAADESSPVFNQSVKDTLDWAVSLVTNVRKDSQHGVVLPYGWEFTMLRSDSSFTSQTSEIIRRYNSEIAAGLLQGFAYLASVSSAREAVVTHLEDFLASCDALLSEFAETINTQLIDRYAEWFNADVPRLKFDSVRTYDLSSLASFVARLVANGVIRPTTELEEALLRIASLPKGDDVWHSDIIQKQ